MRILDNELEKAVRSAVGEKGQSEDLAELIIAWLELQSRGKVDKEEETGFFERILNEINIENGKEV